MVRIHSTREALSISKMMGKNVTVLRFSCAGQLTCSPNKSNPRDLDIVIEYSFKGKNSSAQGRQEYRMR